MENQIESKKKPAMGRGILGNLLLAGALVTFTGGLSANMASIENAMSTNRRAQNLSAVALQKNGALSRENELKFLQSIGYEGKLGEDQSVYLRPVVDGFWSDRVEVVIAPTMSPNGRNVDNGNILRDAYTKNPQGEVIRSFTKEEIAERYDIK